MITKAPIFEAISTARIAALLQNAVRRAIYVAPGIHEEAAAALVELTTGPCRPDIAISLDFNEETLRMGYGTLAAVERLKKAGIEPTHSPGLRCGILIVDDKGWFFSPTALYLESEPQSAETPNAVRLSPEQIAATAIRISPKEQQAAVEQARTPEEAKAIASVPQEVGVMPISPEHIQKVRKSVEEAPPVKFDVARQVRVFQPLLQYIELGLSGAAIQRKRIQIPRALQNLGSAKTLEGKLRTTVELLEKSGPINSRKLEEELNKIRKDFTRTLGKEHGRVMLKSSKARLQARLEEFRKQLENYQADLEKQLDSQLQETMRQIVDYYLPLVEANPPDALLGSVTTLDQGVIRRWIEYQLAEVFPDSKSLVGKIELRENYKDITFETLNRPEFLEEIKAAFPEMDWEKTYNDFLAAAEAGPRPNRTPTSP